MNDDASEFYGYMEDTNQIIYQGCKFTKLSVIVHLFYNKSLKKITETF